MLNYLKSLALVLALLPGTAFSLGLGEPELLTHLNEPLKIVIPVLNANELGVDDIKAKIASNQMFEKYDMQRSYVHSNMQVEVNLDPEGNMYLTILTRELFKEPFLHVLLDVRWAGGNIFKEITLLLDMPR